MSVWFACKYIHICPGLAVALSMSSNGMTMAGILLKARSQEKNTILNEVQAQFAGFGKILHWASLGFSWVCNGSLPSQIFLPKQGNLGDLESTDANYRPQFSIFAKSSGGPWAG